MDSSQMSMVGGVYAGADVRTQQDQNKAVTPITNWSSTPVDPSDSPAKTPVSLLQECCTRKGLTPVYELLSTEGQVHEPTFVYRVTVNDMVASGQGKSKKMAKHLAAKGLLEAVVNANRYVEWQIPGRSHSEAMEYLRKLLPEGGKGWSTRATAGQDGAEGEGQGAGEKKGANPIGKLHEKCMRNRWPPPEYELVEEIGQPHERTFIVSIKLGKFEEKGEAKNKKTAKRQAAEKMLAFLNELPKKQGFDADEDGLLEELAGPGDAYSLEMEEQLKSLSQSKQEEKSVECASTAEENSNVSPEKPKENSGMQELNLTADLSPSKKSTELLERVSLEEKFMGMAPEYFYLPRRSINGQYQCLVQLSTMPVAVCYGSGKSKDDAQFAAAYNALCYLKLMIKNGGIKQ